MRVARSASKLSIALAAGLAMASSSVLGAGPPSGLDVRVTNTPLTVQGTVSVSNFPAAAQRKIITLRADVAAAGACAPLGGLSANFNTIINPDGTTAAFVIPAGTVLVVTAADVLGFGVAPGAGIQTRLWLGTTDIVEFAIRESDANASGRIFHRYEFPTGVEVASSGRVCVNANDFNLEFSGYLYGYLKSAQ